MQQALDQLLDEAAVSRRVPGVVAGIFDSNGTRYEGAFGMRDLSSSTPMELDAVSSIMSMTKAIAGVACLQGVERGLLKLDQPAREIVPWLGEVEVLEGFDAAGQPVLRPPRTNITLRNLLTHTSGFVYNIWNADQARYLETTGRPGINAGTRDAYRQPLAFDPGTRWEYGIGIDWATMMLEEVTGRILPDILDTEVFAPLGMTDTSYTPTPPMRARLGPIHQRDKHGRFQATDADPLGGEREYNGGGGGLFSTLGDYGRFVRTILRGGELDGQRVLSPETVGMAGQNHIGDLRVTMLPSMVPAASADAEFFPGLPKTWGLTFQINEEQAPTGRPAGSLSWAGLANTFFWIDTANDLAGVFMTQTLPFADPGVIEVFEDFERIVYEQL
jgi:methyl acetate hydrolase